jgi:hypothetical protein
VGEADASIRAELDRAIQALGDTASLERTLVDQLWSAGRLQQIPPRTLDKVDELAARLAATAVARRLSCCLILPSAQPDRGPLLFATALLTHWWMGLGEGDGIPAAPVLYVGNSSGVRTALERTAFRGGEVTLDQFFGQNDGSRVGRRGRRGRATKVVSGLPTVVVAYRPPDPIGLIQRYRPSWVAVDLTGGREASWLPALAMKCSESRVPILAWTDTPLSSEFQVLASLGPIIPLPPAVALPNGSYETLMTLVTPLVMDGEVPGRISALLAAAGGQLLAARRAEPTSRLVGDAVRAHWALLRNIESLPCPLDFWEANVAGHWGLRRVTDLKNTCERFQQAAQVSYPAASDPLQRAGAALSEAIDCVATVNPRWEATLDLCMAGAPDEEQIEVNFVSRGRRALFAEALLARIGFTEQDLSSVRVLLRSIPAARDSMEPPCRRLILASGVSTADFKAQRYLLCHEEVEMLVYESGLRAAMSLTGQLADGGSPQRFADALKVMTGRELSVGLRSPRVSLGAALAIQQSGIRQQSSLATPSDGVLGADEELQRLLGVSQDDDESSPMNETPDQPPAAVDAIVSVDFADGWHGNYLLDQTVMVVERTGLRVKRQDCLARDLQVGNEVIAIHGQQRQSLYELLISRLHRNPAIELHLALLDRWQDEVEAGYAAWAGRGRTLDDLLHAMRAKGSTITSISGVRLWVTGGTLAPQDADDVRRLGEVLERGFVVVNFARIAQAATRLRGLHRGLAQRMDNWLEDEATREDAGDDAIIDADAGIRFSDFRGSLLHLTVTAVRIQSGIFLPYRLGFIERGTPSV